MDVIWTEGVDDYKKYTLSIDADTKKHHFHTDILDVEFPNDRNMNEIFADILQVRQTKTVEILYSGGMDSECVLRSCLINKIPVRAVTMRLIVDQCPVNTHDLYYSEKFCRENDVEQVLIDLDVTSFFENGDYLKYTAPYYIVEPHVATHLWLFEQCTGFPVLGGEYSWPWNTKPVISPHKISFNSYTRFLADKNIHGIGNMLNCSLEANVLFIKTHNRVYNDAIHNGENDKIIHLKRDLMRELGMGELEMRLKNYGWEDLNPRVFNKVPYKVELMRHVGSVSSSISWGKKIADALGGGPGYNDKFR
jgi:hypothetical protein